jgi:hypothetical protein
VVGGAPDLERYLRCTASGELVWTLHGVTYEADDQDETLTLRREHRVLVLTRAPDSTLAARSTTLSSSDAPEDEREKWEELMALVERQAI